MKTIHIWMAIRPDDDGHGIGPVFCSSLSVILAATQIPVSSSSLDPSCYRSWAGLGSTFKQSTREHFLVLGLVALGSRAQESTGSTKKMLMDSSGLEVGSKSTAQESLCSTKEASNSVENLQPGKKSFVSKMHFAHCHCITTALQSPVLWHSDFSLCPTKSNASLCKSSALKHPAFNS